MKNTMTTFILMVHVTVVFCQQVSRHPDRSHDYWMQKNIVDNYSKKQSIGKSKYPFQSIVFSNTDNKIYMTTWGTEYIWPIGKNDNNRSIADLTMGDLSDKLYKGKHFALRMGRDSLILNIAEETLKIDSLIFLKPNPHLKQKSRDEILFSYLLSGRYIHSNNSSLAKDTISLALDGKVSGLDSISNWKLGHLFGITKPKSNNFKGVVTLDGTTIKQYYAIFDYINKSWSFYRYQKDKRSIYHLNKEPDIVLKFTE